MREPEEFQKQVKEKRIAYWHIGECWMCNYPLGFHFIDGNVFYDNGCNCTSGRNLNPRTWEQIAEMYNMQSNPKFIKKMDKFFGFKPIIKIKQK